MGSQRVGHKETNTHTSHHRITPIWFSPDADPKEYQKIFKAELKLKPLATDSETEFMVGPNQGDNLLKQVTDKQSINI